MAERNAAAGYIAIGKQSVPGTPVTPTNYTPYYDQSMVTDIHLISDEPVYGNKFKRYTSLQGVRSHGGSVTVMAEPNTAAYWHDMLATKGTTTGANPYTHPFTQSATVEPNYYTMDISFVSQVVRFWGVQASKIGYGWQDQRMQFSLDTSALGSFYGREIASVTGSTVTLKTDYDPIPTTGLVNNDLVTVKKVDGSVSTNYTVTSFTNTTVTLSATAAAFAAGDMIVLRPATPSLTLLTPFLWGKTQFCFGATASAALSATQTRLDPGTEMSIMHEFNSDEGEARSGGLDPASLVRKQYDAEFKVKRFFDLPDDLRDWNAITKRAVVMRAYSGSTNQYELRVTLNNLKMKANPIKTESGGVIYQEQEFAPEYDNTDGQAFDVKVINAVATV